MNLNFLKNRVKFIPHVIESTSPLLRAALPEKKRFFKEKILYTALILSLSLNIYFFYFQSETHTNSATEAKFHQNSKMIVKPELNQSHIRLVKSSEQKISKTKPVALKSIPKLQFSQKEKLEFTLKKVDFIPFPEVKKKVIHSLTFKVKKSLNYSVCEIIPLEEGCRQLSAYIGRLLAWNIDLSHEARKNDSVSLIYEILKEPEKFHILKLNYKSIYYRKTFEANYYQVPGRKYGTYFDSTGREIHPRLVDEESPIRDFIEITSLPGDYRKGRFKGHRGTDFKAPTGTPIYAVFDGKVTRRNWKLRSNGYSLEIDHPSQKIMSRYLHLSQTLVEPGIEVKQGQKIAESGNTGHSFAPHLHYEIEQKGSQKNLLNPFKSGKHKTVFLQVPKARMEEFKQLITSYNNIFQNS